MTNVLDKLFIEILLFY